MRAEEPNRVPENIRCTEENSNITYKQEENEKKL
jgi:hypothetical protein